MTVSRRAFLAGSIVTLAVSATRVGAQDISEISGTTVTSELTGATIDLGRSGFEFILTSVNDATGEEGFDFSNDVAIGRVGFVPEGAIPAEYLNTKLEDIDSANAESILHGYDSLDDGAWMAIAALSEEGVSNGIYMEYQVGAFDGYDLFVYLNSPPESFPDDFAAFQQIDLAGGPPALFLEESGIESLEFPVLVSSTTGTSNRSRSTRRTRGESGDNDETNSRRSSRGQQTGSGDTNDYVEAVTAHKEQFRESLDEFFELANLTISETASDEETNEAFAAISELAMEWLNYPAVASELTAPSDLASLDDVYRDWADEIGALGSNWMDALVGVGDFDQFFAQLEVVEESDGLLAAELEAL